MLDDASTDGVDVVIKEYITNHCDERFIYIRNLKNIRQGLTRNLGVTACKGDYFMFMDHDDILPPDALLNLVENLTNEDLVIGNYATFDTNDINRKIVTVGKIDEQTFYTASQESFSNYYNYVYPWSKLYRREFWLQNNFKFNAVFFEDTAIWPAIITRAKDSIRVVSKVVYLFRTGNALSSGSVIVPEYKKYYVALRERLTILQKYGLLDKENYFISYCISDAYSYINDQDFVWQRYRIFLLLKHYIPKLPEDEFLCDIIPSYKLKKIRKMYSLGWLYFIYKPKTNFIKRKIKVCLK